LLLSDTPAGFFHKAEESRKHDDVSKWGTLFQVICLCVPWVTHVDAGDVLEWIVGRVRLGIHPEST
jgi:hypothetical protein